jgi:type I restriction enzyme S subunit
MSSDWDSVEIGAIAKLRSGFPFKSADWTEEGVPVIKIANVKGGRIVRDGCGFVSPEVAKRTPEWFTKEGDVLIAMTGYVGEVAYVRPGERFLINQRVGRFEFHDRAAIDSKFFFYHLQLPEIRSEIEGVARGQLSLI